MFPFKCYSWKIAVFVVFDNRQQDVVVAQHQWTVFLQVLLGQVSVVGVHVYAVKKHVLHHFAVVLQSLLLVIIKI